MTLNNFVRLADAKPIFFYEKFKMPKDISINKVKPIMPIVANAIQMKNPVVSTNIETGTTINVNSKLKPGAVATYFVLGSLAIIVITTIYINQTT